MYTIRTGELTETLDQYTSIKGQMFRVANEKEKYYSLLHNELKLKYKNSDKLDELFEYKHSDEFTYSISLKRFNFKKQ